VILDDNTKIYSGGSRIALADIKNGAKIEIILLNDNVGTAEILTASEITVVLNNTPSTTMTKDGIMIFSPNGELPPENISSSSTKAAVDGRKE
jgi:hypothetical protein